MSTLKGTTMHPRCRHIGACWDLLEWFQLFSTSQNTSRIQFWTYLKKNQIIWFICCSTREDLSVDISITYVGLILTKPGRFFFLCIRKLDVRTEFNFVNFEFKKKKKITFLGFHGLVLVKTILLMYQLLM